MEPYIMRTNDSQLYKGFLVDLLQLIADELKFQYTFVEQTDYGRRYIHREKPKWTGIAGGLINKVS